MQSYSQFIKKKSEIQYNTKLNYVNIRTNCTKQKKKQQTFILNNLMKYTNIKKFTKT